MAITKVTRNLLSTGIDDQSNATAITIDSSENVGIGTSNATPSNGEGMCLGSSSAITRLDMRNSTTGDATGDGTSLQLNGNNFTIENREAGYVAFSTSLTERMRIDSSGIVHIGTGTAINDTNVKLQLNAPSGGEASLGINDDGAYALLIQYSSGNYARIRNIKNTPMLFETNNTERMRIDSSGNLLVGATAALSVSKVLSSFNGATHNGYVAKTTYAGTGSNFAVFLNSGNQVAGSINHNGTTSVAYNTSSDYRLKENVDYDFTALDRVAQLKPARFNFIADADTTVDGFLAHEVQDIIPEAVTGEKDAVDSEGNPEYQGIDQSKLVPLLTKAIQEQQTIIDDLKARLDEAGL